MRDISTEIVIILALILLNGLFAMSEMAIVSARRSRLQQRAENGDKGSRIALALAENPNRFLSTVQIGITTIGILSGAFGGATLAENIGLALSQIPWLAPYSQGIGVAIVVISITFFSLLVGELIPKRLALNNAERIASAVAPSMQRLSVLASPLVILLSAATNFILRIMGIKPSTEPEVTEDDLKSMLDRGTETGVFEESEQDMVERIFRLNDRSASALMTPRMDIVFLDIEASHEEIQQQILSHPFSRFPVFLDTPDNVVGIILARDLLLQRVDGPHFDIRKSLLPPLFIPESTNALRILEQFKRTGMEMAVVIDEYGGVMGLVSMNDIIDSIVGDVTSPRDEQEAEAVRREDGSWLFDGLIQIDDLLDHMDIDELPEESEGSYETLSGFVMAKLGRVPATGDHFEWGGFRFEVVDMDGRRVDKVLVSQT